MAGWIDALRPQQSTLFGDQDGAKVIVGDRLRALREGKRLSPEDVEQRAGLPGGYVADVEGGNTVLSTEAIEKISQVLDVPMFKLFYDDEVPKLANLQNRLSAGDIAGIESTDAIAAWPLHG